MRSPLPHTAEYLIALAVVVSAATFAVFADEGDAHFQPGNLVVSVSHYHDDPDNVTIGMSLPPSCVPPNCVAAQYDGTYPTVFNNAVADASFGITSRIFLDQLTPSGHFVNRIEVPNSANSASQRDQMVTSFSSKSELALNLSTDHQILTFMGYLAPVDAVDVSNSNTPAVVDPTNPVPATADRIVAEVDRRGHFQFTKTNAYRPSNMCVLAGFPTLLAKSANGVGFPFGLWFANATTLYVADEGDGFNSDATLYDHAKAQTSAGLQKWVFDANAKAWRFAYTLQAGLDLGLPYTVKNYPTGPNPGSAHVAGLPWSPATDGLRNLTGRVNNDGTVTIWAITSTVSGSGDQGADPNKLVAITDRLTATTLPANESFAMLRTARFGEVLRGVSFTPGTGSHHPDDDERGNKHGH